MDSSPELQGSENYSPEQKQIQLKSVYESLPARSVMKDKFNSTLQEKTSAEPDASKHGNVMVETAHGQLKGTFNNELRNIKFEELKQLLSRAKITTTLKDNILAEFKMGFGFGVEKDVEESLNAGTFTMIGATNKSDIKEGIFSEDPNIRLGIEQKYLQNLVDAIEDARKNAQKAIEEKRPEDTKRYTDNGQLLQERINKMKQEMETIYPATSPPKVF
jgi:flagellar biosynthesis/type III secretory pathway protein FliH